MRTWNRCVFTAILRILYQPRRRIDHRTAPRGQKARRERSCRSIRPFNQRGAAAGGTRSGILSFARAGQIFSTPFGGSPVKKQGVRGRRDRALSNAREPPPAVFWFLLHRCKRNSPAGEIPQVPFRNLAGRADGDIRPYGGERQQVVRGGRTLCAPTVRQQPYTAYSKPSHPPTEPRQMQLPDRFLFLPIFSTNKNVRYFTLCKIPDVF